MNKIIKYILIALLCILILWFSITINIMDREEAKKPKYNVCGGYQEEINISEILKGIENGNKTTNQT